MEFHIEIHGTNQISSAQTEKERIVKKMGEYITCRSCESPDCKGCNLKRLETMLEDGAFNCLMNENRAINISADVALVRNGRWIQQPLNGTHIWRCSKCETLGSPQWNYCPKCGAKMGDKLYG